jgi:hypothetical protein
MALYRALRSSTVILLAFLSSSVALTAPASLPQKKFEINGRTFTGTSKTICVIKGQWSDGEDFRYEAWDTCNEMSLKRQTHGRSRYTGARAR